MQQLYLQYFSGLGKINWLTFEERYMLHGILVEGRVSQQEFSISNISRGLSWLKSQGFTIPMWFIPCFSSLQGAHNP